MEANRCDAETETESGNARELMAISKEGHRRRDAIGREVRCRIRSEQRMGAFSPFLLASPHRIIIPCDSTMILTPTR